MQTLSWLPFGVSSSITRTIVHFFPCADSVTAPYPANCALTLFGSGLQMRSVVLEGGRLSNPDGLRLEDAFPELKAESPAAPSSGLFGLMVEISSPQPRLNLEGSGCIVEFSSRGYQNRYWPSRGVCRAAMPDSSRLRPSLLSSSKAATEESVALDYAKVVKSGIAIRDAAQSASMVVVNASDKSVKGTLLGASAQSSNPLIEIAAYSVNEISLDDAFYNAGAIQECSWGEMKARALNVSFEIVAEPVAGATVSGDTAASPAKSLSASNNSRDSALPLSSMLTSYMLYREANSRRILSVTAM